MWVVDDEYFFFVKETHLMDWGRYSKMENENKLLLHRSVREEMQCSCSVLYKTECTDWSCLDLQYLPEHSCGSHNTLRRVRKNEWEGLSLGLKSAGRFFCSLLWETGKRADERSSKLGESGWCYYTFALQHQQQKFFSTSVHFQQ